MFKLKSGLITHVSDTLPYLGMTLFGYSEMGEKNKEMLPLRVWQ